MSTTQQVHLECEDEGVEEETKPKKETTKKRKPKKKSAVTEEVPEDSTEQESKEEQEEPEEEGKSKSPFVLLPDLNIFSMALLHDEGEYETYVNPDDPEEGYVIRYRPFDFYISTYGGSASDMFAIYDVMQSIKKDSDICTIGLGKVMSAGVLLLAAGTRGKRKIGANCRVMLHGVIAGSSGSLISIENEMEETKIMQKMYIQAISENTNMSESYLRKLIKRNTNVYLSAKEAVELGIADEII
mgnify:CR=1 FL=1